MAVKRRAQPYRLESPLTGSQVENIDEMFEILFRQMRDLTSSVVTLQASAAAPVLGTTPSGILYPVNGVDGEPGIPGLPGIPGDSIIGPAGLTMFIPIEGEQGIPGLAAFFNSLAGRTIAAGANISVTNGDGSAGNPTIAVTLPWTSQVYAAGDYTPDAGTWTVDAGDVVTSQYIIIGNLMIFQVDLQTTTVATNPTILSILIPASKTATAQASFPLFLNDNGVNGTGLAQVTNGGNKVRCLLLAFGTWAASTNNSYVRFTVQIPI